MGSGTEKRGQTNKNSKTSIMGFFKAFTTKKVYIFEQENKGRIKILPLSLFRLVKLFLDELLHSRARLRFALQDKYNLSSFKR